MYISERFWIIVLLISVFHINSRAQFSFSNDIANTTKSGAKSVRLLNEVTSNAELSQYGGNLNSRTTATGYFQIKKVKDCWYLVDPDGYLFFTVGICSIVKGGGIELPESLRNIGANTMGCWADETINIDTDKKMAYCPRWNFMSTYKNSNQRLKDLFAAGIIPVFDPAYITFCDGHARQLIPSKDDPFLLGHFSDNELPIYDNSTYGNLLDRFLAIQDKTDPNYLAAKNWIVNRKGENYAINNEDRELFHGFVTGTYYRITSEAIRRYDPNHLYLGSRLHGAAKSKPSIYLEAAKYVDMISINVYGVWTPSTSDMDMWSAGGKPFFVTEFYAMADDTGLSNASGAGWEVPTQDDRAKYFENFTLALIEHPGCVGYHYFKYIDDDGSNKGLVNASFQWYDQLKNSFHKVARNIYGLREFMTGKTTGLRKYKSSENINIYTDPNSGKIKILPLHYKEISDIQVYSLSGMLVSFHKSVELPFSFELSACPSGMYIVNVRSGDHAFSDCIIKN